MSSPEPVVTGACSGVSKPLSEWGSQDNYSSSSVKTAKPDSPDSVPGGFAQKVIDTVRTRGKDYGHPSDNHQLTADLLSSFARRRFGLTPEQLTFTAEDVCTFNILQKLSRLAEATKDDTWLDVSGYAENVAMLRPDQRNARGGAVRAQ